MMLPAASPDQKILILGTALWGWGIDRETAHQMLDRFVALGGCIIDTAANYPINKRPEDFGLAVTWIADWIAANGTEHLSVLVKVGAMDNMGGPNSELGISNLIHSEAFFRTRFGAALAAIAVHWDNRGDDENDSDAIAETVNTLVKFQESGLSIGFSGVRRPYLYLKAAPEQADRWWIQVKENVQSGAARLNYAKYFPRARYLAYGINMGGVKNEPYSESSSVVLRGIKEPEKIIERLSGFIHSNHGIQPAPKNFNELALLTSYLNPALCGVIIGPRNKEQLESSMKYWDHLKTESSAGDAAKLLELRGI